MLSKNKVEYHCSCIMINNLITKNEVAFACLVKVLLHYDCTHLVTKTHMQRAAIPALQLCRRRKAEFLHTACSTGAAGPRGHPGEYGWRQ